MDYQRFISIQPEGGDLATLSPDESETDGFIMWIRHVDSHGYHVEPIRRLDSVWASPGRVSGKIRRRDWCARHLLITICYSADGWAQ